MALIASLAAFLLWLLGTSAERAGLRQRLHPTNAKRRVYSKVFLARVLLVVESCRHELDPLTQAIFDVDQWVADNHDALLTE